MGASASFELRTEEVADLTEETRYEPKEIKTLYRRFRRLDRSARGTLSADDLTMIPEVAMNPLAPRLVAMFERDGEDRINFRSFARGLSVLSDKSSPATKCKGAELRSFPRGGARARAHTRAAPDPPPPRAQPSSACTTSTATASSARRTCARCSRCSRARP
jgi:hypothetical protein